MIRDWRREFGFKLGPIFTDCPKTGFLSRVRFPLVRLNRSLFPDYLSCHTCIPLRISDLMDESVCPDRALYRS